MDKLVAQARLYFSEVIAEDFRLIHERVGEMVLYQDLVYQKEFVEDPVKLLTIEMSIEYLLLKAAEKSKPRTFMDAYARIAFIAETKIRMMRLDYDLYIKWTEYE